MLHVKAVMVLVSVMAVAAEVDLGECISQGAWRSGGNFTLMSPTDGRVRPTIMDRGPCELLAGVRVELLPD